MSYFVYRKENRSQEPYSYRVLRITYCERKEEDKKIIYKQKGVRFIEPVLGRINLTTTSNNTKKF